MAVAFGVRPRESSNSFASGANQNCGNVITGTPTTRVTQPPGGGSSLSLAWDTPQVPNDCRRSSLANTRAELEARRSQEPGETSPPSRRSAMGFGYAKSASTSEADAKCRFQAPGGTSTISLAWEDGTSRIAPDRWQNATPKMRRPVQESGSQQQRYSPPTADSSEDCSMQRSCQFGNGTANFLRALEARRLRAEPRCDDAYAKLQMGGYDGVDVRDSEMTPDYDSCPAAARRVPGQYESGEQPNSQLEASSAGGISDEGWSAPAAQLRSTTSTAAGLPAGRPSSGKVRSPAHVESVVPLGSTAPVRRKEEIEGSRPRVWQPSIRLRAPPGGGSSFNSDWSGGHISGPKGGKKLFPEAGGAGTNRDSHTIEALRYYADSDDRVGKLKVQQEDRHWPEKSALDVQRYYLAAEGLNDRTPGRARRFSQSGGDDDCTPRHGAGMGMGVADRPRTAPGYAGDQDCCNRRWHEEDLPLPRNSDTLPLGAEWSSWGSGVDRRSNGAY